MSRTLSLRAHLLFGVVLWTIGLFISAGIFVTHLMLVHPETSRTVHGPFVNAWPIGTVAVICMIGGLFQVRRGLSAIVQLRRRLGAVHEGRERTIDGTYPSEVQPLVTDLNALLDHREKAVKRALGKAGDLAHGLKTPLAVLSQEAERAGAAGHTEIAAAVAEQVERMRRQIDYHLAHARAAASGATPGARCRVVDAADGLARTLRRLYAGRGLTIELAVAADHTVRCQREDLDEMLGCLLDNACKWARQHITITSIAEPAAIVILVDDDGPGLEPSKRSLVLQRGVRADESAPGSGFGLAIVRDLAELYGGSIELDSSPAGGLRATLKLARSEGF
jgi:signal transduction histidine kinase